MFAYFLVCVHLCLHVFLFCHFQGHAALFKDLHSHPLLPNQKVEESLALARRTVSICNGDIM